MERGVGLGRVMRKQAAAAATPARRRRKFFIVGELRDWESSCNEVWMQARAGLVPASAAAIRLAI